VTSRKCSNKIFLFACKNVNRFMTSIRQSSHASQEYSGCGEVRRPEISETVVMATVCARPAYAIVAGEFCGLADHTQRKAFAWNQFYKTEDWVFFY
jgi:hypothetical protein